MSDDAANQSADEPTGKIDPEQLKGALGRTGRMLQSAGLPFEHDEFGDDDESSSSSSDSSDSSSSSDEPGGEG